MLPSRLLAACCLIMSMTAQAEAYKWVDADGKTHFGDRKPSATTVETLNLPAASTPSVAPTINDDFKERQRKLLHAMDEEREAKQAADLKRANNLAKQQKNCVELRDYLRNISSGRLYTLNAKGERIYASDGEHEKEIKDVQQMISQQCR